MWQIKKEVRKIPLESGNDPHEVEARSNNIEKYGRHINDSAIDELVKLGIARGYINKLATFARNVYGEKVNGREYLRHLFQEEIRKKSQVTPLYEVSKRYYNLTADKRMTRSQLWGKWFAPLKMWAKGGTATMIKKIENDMLKNKKKLTSMSLEKLLSQYSQSVDFLPWISAAISQWVSNDFDFMMSIVGYEGTGKSSLALALSRDLTYYGFDFDIVENIFFGSTPVDYIISRIENDEHQVFIFDEADAFFDSRNFMKKDQKRLVTSIVMNRARNHVYILATPDVSSIDVRFRERRITHILHILDRNLVALLMKHNSGRSQDGFMYRQVDRLLQKALPTAKVLAKEFATLPTCYGLFKMNGPPISSQTYELYKRFKMELNRMSEATGKDVSRNVIGTFLKYVLTSKKYSAAIPAYAHNVGLPPSVVYTLFSTISKQLAPGKIKDLFQNSQEYLERPETADLLGVKGVTSVSDKILQNDELGGSEEGNNEESGIPDNLFDNMERVPNKVNISLDNANGIETALKNLFEDEGSSTKKDKKGEEDD